MMHDTSQALSRREALARSLGAGVAALGVLAVAGCERDAGAPADASKAAEATQPPAPPAPSAAPSSAAASGSPPPAGGGHASSLPAGVDPAALVCHTQTPLVCETRRELTGTPITATERLFIRNNLPAPDAAIVRDPDAWTFAVEGVARPRSVTVGELKRLGLAVAGAVVQCSGNGRAWFPHKAPGTPWTCGAAGSVLFAGLPVRALIEALGGPVPTMGSRFVTARGADPVPQGLDPERASFERSVPLDKALADGLLAWEMNGVPLPLVHGGPLRLVIPGYFGVNHVKYVTRLALTAEESRTTWQQTNYRMSPLGEKGKPEEPSVWAMPPKSWITSPLGAEPLRAGRILVTGIAFGGARPLARVEVSVDLGQTWRAAQWVGPDLGAFAWRPFTLVLDLPAGDHQLASRAVDASGEAQPERRVENQSGYANNSWSDLAVEVEVRA